MRAGCGIGLADRDFVDEQFGLRPLVCLKADVKLVESDVDIGNPDAKYYELTF